MQRLILVNKINRIIVVCASKIEVNEVDRSFIIDNMWGYGVTDHNEFEVIEIDGYIEPNKYLYVDGEFIENPAYREQTSSHEIDMFKKENEILKGAIHELAGLLSEMMEVE